MEKKRVPFEEQVANNIIKALENRTAPWIKPWKGSQLQNMIPVNLTTKKPYNGVNYINLLMTAIDKGYTDPRWMTFNQARNIGAKIKKGEKASLVKIYIFTEKREVLDEDGKPILDEKGKPLKEEVELENPKLKWHYVFNAQQCENVPELEKSETTKDQREFEAIEAAEKILENSGADIRHIEGNRAYYSPVGDFIVLPKKEQFLEAGEEIGYYSTALHELGHWTGHESRLNRDLGNGFGTPSYAKEELRAEIASFMMCSKLGLDFDPQQHYAYIDSWIKTLKDDPKEITKASRDAMKITNFVIQLQKEKIMQQDKNKSMTQILKEEINKFDKNGNTPKKDVSKIQEDAVFLKETLTNGKINLKQFNDKEQIESQLNELRDAIIYAQSQMLQEELQPYTKSVLESTLSMLKEVETTLETNLNKEVNYSKEIKDNHQKIVQKDTANEAVFTEKTYLLVKYREKEEAKRAGAKWDKEAKSWYAPAGASKEKLKQWTFEYKQYQNMQNSINPAAEFKEILEQNGFILEGLPILDGKIHRIDVVDKKRGNKNGWYRGFSDGRPNAVFGDYSKGQDKASNALKWKSMSSNFETGYNSQKAAKIKAEHEAKRAAAQKELLKAQQKTAYILEKEFIAAPNANNKHPYLIAKGVKNYDLKLDKRGNLLMPLRDAEGKLWAVQRIGLPDKKTGKTFKMIGVIRSKEEKAKGIEYPAKMDGTFFVINEKALINSKQIMVVEGYSTGATVHEATNLPVIVAVHSGNLEKVTKALADKYPQKQIIIAGDNDLANELKGKENIGKLKAEAAALAVKGEAVLPSFTKEELAKGASDWNDLAKSRGIKEVKKQLDIALKRLKNRETAQKINKTQEQNQQQNKIRRREVVRKQALSRVK